MNQTLDPALEPVVRAFASPTRGVVGVVDDLLAGCPDDGLRLVWADGVCRISRPAVAAEEATAITIPRSVFRAILARVAALCNEAAAGSVSPYGGRGTFAGFRAGFANTPSDQWLDLSRLAVA
jgi:hypothetical protein